MESVFSNFPGCKLPIWVRVVSTTHASLQIQEYQFFGTFQNGCFNYDHFLHAFAKHHAFLAVFALLHFCVSVQLSLHHYVKGNFNFWITHNFRYSSGVYRTQGKDLRCSFFFENRQRHSDDNYIQKKLHLRCLNGFLIRSVF